MTGTARRDGQGKFSRMWKNMQCRPAGGVSTREQKKGLGINMALTVIQSSECLR